MRYALMGHGGRRVRCISTPQCDTVIGEWPSGQTGTVRGIREGAGGFGFAAHYERGHHTAVSEGAGYYREMLRAIVGMFTSRRAPIEPAESREIIAFIAAALRSSQVRGAPRPLE